ncbi:MAG: hypothetical protein H0U95_16340 [Bacteroidetes bacterium]|nr:hypothetical protein [Bacteroidota bacterium]
MKNLLIIISIFSSVNVFYSQAIVSKWPNGKIQEEGVLIDSCFIGKYKSYNEQGSLIEEGEFIPASYNNVFVKGVEGSGIDTLAIKKDVIKNASVKTGKWIYYSNAGKKIEEGTYLPQSYIELIQTFNPENSTIVYNYNKELPGTKTGLWRFYDENGILDYEQTFVNGAREGIRSEYYVNGKLKAQGVFDEQHFRKKGIWKEYDDKGNLSSTVKYDNQGNSIK